MRTPFVLALIGATAVLLPALLRPASGAAGAPRPAREGHLAARLQPGESLRYVLDLAGHRNLTVNFRRAEVGLGLRVEDGAGLAVADLGPRSAGARTLDLGNPTGLPRTLVFTVHRADGATLPRRKRATPEAAPSVLGEPGGGGFELDLAVAEAP